MVDTLQKKVLSQVDLFVRSGSKSGKKARQILEQDGITYNVHEVERGVRTNFRLPAVFSREGGLFSPQDYLRINSLGK